MKKIKNKDYLECESCNKNNWDNENFLGCPRGFCDAKVKGNIKISLTVIK